MTYVTKYSAYASPQPNRFLFYYPAELQLGFESDVKPRLVREFGASFGQVRYLRYIEGCTTPALMNTHASATRPDLSVR